MLTVPFLTDLDSRAAVKGSRDPLGIQQIWTRLGRYVVGNLTTVSNSVRDFTTLLLGYYFAAPLADQLGPGTELGPFLKWEQLAAYARATVNKDFAFRGTERVRKRLSEGSRVTLSDDRGHQILSDQQTYGLWGLYTQPARASGHVTSWRKSGSSIGTIYSTAFPRIRPRVASNNSLSFSRTHSSVRTFRGRQRWSVT